MNINYIGFAMEVWRAGSIGKAAKNLFLAQPNLSNCIKELEKDIGFEIFKRTKKGVQVTEEGRNFLNYSKLLLKQVEFLENYCKAATLKDILNLKIISVRSSCASQAFSEFVESVNDNNRLNLYFKEDTIFNVIENIHNKDFDIGTLIFPKSQESYYKEIFDQRNIKYENMYDSKVYIMFSKEGPLANKEVISSDDLKDLICIKCVDMEENFVSLSKIMSEANYNEAKNLINIYDRGSSLNLLSNLKNSYYLTQKAEQGEVDKNGLALKVFSDKAFLSIGYIYNKDSCLTEYAKKYIEILSRILNE